MSPMHERLGSKLFVHRPSDGWGVDRRPDGRYALWTTHHRGENIVGWMRIGHPTTTDPAEATRFRFTTVERGVAHANSLYRTEKPMLIMEPYSVDEDGRWFVGLITVAYKKRLP